MGMYDDDTPRRRRSIVPILAIIAAVLAIAVGIAVVLFALGYFDKPGGPPASRLRPPPAPTRRRRPTASGAQSLDDTTPASGQTDVPKAVVSVAPPGQGEPPVRSTHGDWQVRCDTPAGAQAEQCVLMQFVTAEDRDNVGLTVIILKTADKKARIMRILAPLGVLLPSGLGLKIDATDMGRAGFVRCLPNGCVAEVILEDQAC